MRKLYTVPFGYLLSFLKEKIKDENFEEIGIVFPNKRPSLYLKALLSKEKGAFYPPQIFSMEEFVEYLSKKVFEYQTIDHPDALFLLFDTIRELRPTPFDFKNFGDFFAFGHYILNFIDMLDMEKVEEDKLRNVEISAEIGLEVPERINAILTNIGKIRRRFHERLIEKGYATRGLKYTFALKALKEEKAEELKHLYFCGHFALTRVEKEIIRFFFEQERAMIILEGKKEEWPILKELVDYLKAKDEWIEKEGFERKLSIYSAFNTHTEALKVYEILKEGQKGSTVIVLPDPHSLFPILTFAVERTGKDYNITLGYPFFRSSVFSFLSSIIKAQLTRLENGIYRTSEYLSILFHPFVKNLKLKEEEETLLTIERLILERNEPILDLSEIESLFPSLRELHELFFYRFENCQSLEDLADALEELIDFLLSHSEIKSYILSFEFLKALFEVLEKIKGLEIRKIRFHEDRRENHRYLFNFLLFLLKKTVIPFETEPLEDIEIMGVLETRCLSFENVIFLDMNEGIFPKDKRIDPVIPMSIYESLSLPTPKYEEEIFRYYFFRLIGSAKNVHLLYIESDQRPRSRYIEELLWEEEKRQKKLGALAVSRFSLNIDFKKETPMEIRKTDSLLNQIKKMTFSASSVDEYLRCPLSFFFKYCLRLEERPLLREEIEEAERGELIHRILKDTYEGFLNRRIDYSLSERLSQNLKRAIERYIGEKRSGDYYLFKRIVERKLNLFLEKDLKRKEPFSIISLELEIGGEIPINGESLSFAGRIDRVDYLEEKDEYILIDYKTGEASPPKIPLDFDPKSIEEIRKSIESFQLPLYIYLFQRKTGIPLDKISSKLVLLKKNEERDFPKETERATMVKKCIDQLSIVFSDLFDKNRPLRRFDEKFCDKCNFKDICG